MGFKVKCVPVMKQMPGCCCSCDLRVATCIVGWLCLIAYAVILFRASFFLAMFKDLLDFLPHGFREVAIAAVIVGALGIPFETLLLYGVNNEKPQFLLPSVIFGMIITVIIAVAVLVISIYLFSISLLVGFYFLLVGVLSVVLSTFFWVVIYSYYRKLEERRYQFPTTSLDNAGQEVTMHIGHA